MDGPIELSAAEASMPAFSRTIWDMKYRLKAPDKTPIDKTIEDTWRRVATALAQPEEPEERVRWTAQFYQALEAFKFMPGGRIIAGAGTDRSVTLFNCFTMGTIPDDMGGIFAHLREAALTMQQGGGIGYDFSTLRPRGAPVKGVGADASGPLSFMDVWDAMCRTIMSAGYRRGAMMATMSCEHPDIEAFIEAKSEPGRLRMFNLSVLVTDAFMRAVAEDAPWQLSFGGSVTKVLPARELWDKIMRATYAYAEPGVIFIDRINRRNNLWYCEKISATNPCGEQPLPPYGNCLLGSLNLPRLVVEPFTTNAHIDMIQLRKLVPVAVRMLDNVIEISKFPLEVQREEAFAKRRIGLGITGLADALIMCGYRYGSPAAVHMTSNWLLAIEREAYRASTLLAAEKGVFPLFDSQKYLAGQHVKGLDAETREIIAANGMRNSHLMSQQPTGTTAQYGGIISSGIEPIFDIRPHTRKLLMPDGSREEHEVADYAVGMWKKLRGDGPLPDYFVDAQTLSPEDHLVMQAAAQQHTDAAISKTINLPEDISFKAFQDVYRQAYAMGCKSCTTYRPNEVTGSVLSVKASEPAPIETIPGCPHGTEAEQGWCAQCAAGLPGPNGEPPYRQSDEHQLTAILGGSRQRMPIEVLEDAPLGEGILRVPTKLPSPDEVEGKRYRVRWPDSDHALYVIVNDFVDEQTGRKRPWEVFLISNESEADEWRVALGRMISAVYRRGGDVAFIASELRAISDKKGGAFLGGKHLGSVIAAIGDIIERHMIEIGFIPPKEAKAKPTVHELEQILAEPDMPVVVLGNGEVRAVPARTRLRQCPKCGEPALIREEGCDRCTSCDYAKC